MKKIITLILLVFTLGSLSIFSQAGNSLNFDGTNDYVELSSAINLANSSFTLECWFNATTNIASSFSKRFIVSIGATSGGSNQQVNILLQGDGSQAYIKTGFYGSDLVYTWTYDANWYHVAFSYDAATNEGILYLDGSNVASQTFSNDLSGSGRATIGTPAWNLGNETFYGNIDEVRIWNTVRTATEILDNKNNVSLNPSTTGLLAYYHFDQGTGGGDNAGLSTLNDETSHAYNGTLTNFALSGSTSNWIGSNNSALPVELTSFSASNTEGKIILNWQTATEINNYGFEIERKTANESWSKISFVQGYGNSNSTKIYSFEDAFPAGGALQYRLKQIDIDGKFEYSSIVEVNFDSPVSYALNQNHPNPFNPETTISYQLPSDGIVSLKIYDMLGKEVAALLNEYKYAGKYAVKFDGSKLASGTYFYQLSFGSSVETKKLILVK